jgi:ornithine cyclodeaminase/alanine dehydrogenase-like protein (mu-crystallin family)
MDGRFITEARTAAASAVAARYLSRREASTLGILGSGVQARSHLEALPLVRECHDIRAWSPTASKLQQFVTESHGQVRPAATAREAVEGADIVVLATSSPTPVIEGGWVKPGACVISVGACRPSLREMDPELVARARLFVDTRAGALQESGDIVQGIREQRFDAAHIVAELGELVANPALRRQTEDEINVFKSLGMAVEDVAAASLVYQRARESGRGVELV